MNQGGVGANLKLYQPQDLDLGHVSVLHPSSPDSRELPAKLSYSPAIPSK